MKARIFELLNAGQGAVSGASISKQLGISRVAVWKHIQQMQQWGLSLESTAKGYRLVSVPDILVPWVFGDRADRIHCYPEIASTMDEALTLARQGCPENTVVVAERQSKGRGRLQRHWDSQQGGLFFTIVLRPRLTPQQSGRVHLAAAIDMAETLRRTCGVQACLKWPNDILVNERKIVGILSQMETEMDLVKFINVGVGVNINNRVSDDAPAAVSVSRLTGGRMPRAAVLKDFLNRFERRLKVDLDLDVKDAWKAMTVTLGRSVKIKTNQDTVTGTAVDIDSDGALLVALPDGSRRRILFGDCFHQN